MDNRVSLIVKCTHCNESLMDYKKLLNEKPSIKVNVINEDADKGTLWLCSTYGCYDKVSDIPLKKDNTVQIYCPSCKKTLNTEIRCEKCSGNMVKFNIEIGGVVSICNTMDCESHYVMFEELTDTIRKFHNEYGI